METDSVTGNGVSEEAVTPASLEKQIADLMAAIGEVKTTLAPINDQIVETERSIRDDRKETAEENYRIQQEAQRAVAENERLMQERNAKRYEEMSTLQESKFDLSRKLREAERMAESLQRQLDQARRAELAQAEWATLEKRWDQLTMGAPWREWAKDHQLEGGRKITYEGRMILGDTMGLGKTLTSLIAIDMIQAATKDASPDNPIEFGSMK